MSPSSSSSSTLCWETANTDAWSWRSWTTCAFTLKVPSHVLTRIPTVCIRRRSPSGWQKQLWPMKRCWCRTSGCKQQILWGPLKLLKQPQPFQTPQMAKNISTRYIRNSKVRIKRKWTCQVFIENYIDTTDQGLTGWMWSQVHQQWQKLQHSCSSLPAVSEYKPKKTLQSSPEATLQLTGFWHFIISYTVCIKKKGINMHKL